MAETTSPGLAQITNGRIHSSEAGAGMYEGLRQKNIPQIPNLSPRESLLIWQHKQSLEDAIKNHSTVILAAGTGTGKTRGGSQIALEALGPDARMVITENLRRATEESAKVVAADMQVEIGREVGVRNRYSHDFSDQTRLLFCPVQSLLVMMEDDPLLERYNLIAMDEVHKESKANELAMIRLRDIQAERKRAGKPELKLMFISATADKDKIARHFPDAVSVDVPGKTFPVDESYEKRDIPAADLPKYAADKVRESIAAGDRGNILVFLSGKSQIEETAKALGGLSDVEVIPYYSAASKEEQDAIFVKSDKRKVVLATNAAQEGLTLDVNVIVDTGMHKHMELDPLTGREYLVEQKAPRDHLTQRRGRVGRKESPYPGQNDKYYALYTEADRDGRPDHEAAEMQRTDLMQEVLILMAQGHSDIRNFAFINKPPSSHIDIAIERLSKIGAVENGRLTAKGRLMAELQIQPNTASMVVSAAEHGALKQASALAAMLETYDNALEGKNGTISSFRHPDSDVLGLIRVFESFYSIKGDSQRKSWAKEKGFNYYKLHDATRLYDELIRTVSRKKPADTGALEKAGALDRSIAEGYADALVRFSKDGEHFLERAGPLQIGKESSLYGKKAPYIISMDITPITKDGAITSRLAKMNHRLPEDVAKTILRETSSPPVSSSAAPVDVVPAPEPSSPGPKQPTEKAAKPSDTPPKPPGLRERLKKWISESWLGSLWRWITK